MLSREEAVPRIRIAVRLRVRRVSLSDAPRAVHALCAVDLLAVPRNSMQSAPRRREPM
jgi:hypothetical protein